MPTPSHGSPIVSREWPLRPTAPGDAVRLSAVDRALLAYCDLRRSLETDLSETDRVEPDVAAVVAARWSIRGDEMDREMICSYVMSFARP